MRQQVIIIGGGETFKNYQEYINYLEKAQPNLKRNKEKRWKENLKDDLGNKFDVVRLRMPNTDNAKYKEWEIVFKRTIPFLSNNLILIGHSLGGIFLVKYLAENKFPKKIKAIFLVAAPFCQKKEDWLDGFKLPAKLVKLQEQAEKIFIYHSKDDSLVPFSHFNKYKKTIPKAENKLFNKKGHFSQSHFIELTKEIKKLN
jgi:uncharacterized protein